MRAYAIEVSDKWDGWHVVRDGRKLFVFVSREAAQEQIDKWQHIEDRIGFGKRKNLFGIRYRIRPFNEKRIVKKRRKKVLK